MGDGAGFIYHCAEGQQKSRVLRDYTDLATAEGLLPTLIAIHCCAVDPENWTKWAPNDAGGVVWSPLSNLLLYAQTTLIDDARARGVRICLGSDWGPSGTKNLLGEMKVARIAADQFGYTLTDREIVEMVTTNPGVLLERCWHRPVGRLVEGAFADITVLSGRGTGTAWDRIVAATERDVALVVIDGAARYGYSTLMAKAAGPPTFKMTIAGRVRAVALPDPVDTTSAVVVAGDHGHAPSGPAGPADRRSPTRRPEPQPGQGSPLTRRSSCSSTCQTPVAGAAPDRPRTPRP